MLTKSKIVKILDHYTIPYAMHGGNISAKCIGVDCPFCGDTGQHCGIFIDGGNYSCWRCSEAGSFYKLLSEILGISFAEYDKLLHSIIAVQPVVKVEEPPKVEEIKPVILPKEFKPITEHVPLFVITFLDNRRISLETCTKYNLGYCQFGEYAQRIIIPIYINNELVAFQARAAVDHASLRYKTSKVAINNYLYKYDDIDKRMILTEGVFDALRLEDEAVCSFGTHICINQRRLILQKKLNELIFCWDGDAYMKAYKQALWFKPFIDRIKVIRLPKTEDPDSLGKSGTYDIISSTNYL